MMYKVTAPIAASGSQNSYYSITEEEFKHAIYGHTGRWYSSTDEYQEHLTRIQLYVKKNCKDKIIQLIVNQFFQLDYKKKGKWDVIISRLTDEQKPIYEDFICRIKPGGNIHEGPIFKAKFRDYYKMKPTEKRDFQQICDEMRRKKLVRNITPKQLNSLLQGKAPDVNRIVWTGSQYMFTSFLKMMKTVYGYKHLILKYFTTGNGDAIVRDSQIKHENKKYYNDLHSIVEKINRYII